MDSPEEPAKFEKKKNTPGMIIILQLHNKLQTLELFLAAEKLKFMKAQKKICRKKPKNLSCT